MVTSASAVLMEFDLLARILSFHKSEVLEQLPIPFRYYSRAVSGTGGHFPVTPFTCRNPSLESLEQHEVAIIRVADTYVKQVWRLLISDVNEADSSSSDYKIDSPIMTARGLRKGPLS